MRFRLKYYLSSLFLLGTWKGNDLFALGENILVYGAVGSYSQRISMWPVIEALAEKGHKVTFLSPYENKEPSSLHPNIQDYAPTLWKQRLGPWEEHFNFYDIRKNGQIVMSWLQFPNLGVLACESLYEDKEFVDWAKASHFDLVIMDSLMNECALSLVHFWKSKLIVYGTSSSYGWFTDQFGLADESSSVSDMVFNFPRGTEMKFWQRFVNAMYPLVWKVMRDWWYLPTLQEITKKGLGLEQIPEFAEIERNASLVILTAHYSVEGARSLPPNVVTIQGATVVAANKLKPLSKDMTAFIDGAEDGFVYISFGTVAEFTNFAPEVQREFIKAIGKFSKLRFVWKSSFEITSAPLPSNVMVTRWAPQQSLLAHPKIRAFISHTGMGSITETIHFSVPVISLPVLAEQDFNGESVVSKGAGIKLEITTLKEKELEDAIQEVVYNPKYKRAMERLTKVFKDRPMTATENAVWWIEYVLRTENAHEILTPLSVHQPWWVKRQIDVWLVTSLLLITFTLSAVYLAYTILIKPICWKFIIVPTMGSKGKSKMS